MNVIRRVRMWWFALLAPFAGAFAADVGVGTSGHAATLGNTQGLYLPDFPMPENFVSVDTWAKVARVRHAT